MPKPNLEIRKAIKKLRAERTEFKRQSWSAKEIKSKFEELGLTDKDLANVKLTKKYGLQRYYVKDVCGFLNIK